MANADSVISEVLELLEPMVASDGGTIRVKEFSADESRLDVDYIRGVNDACSSCVLDGESLKAFIIEGLQTRGISLAEVTVSDLPPATV